MKSKIENRKNQTVLIIDTDKFLINVYSVRFQANGFIIDSSLSSRAALDKLRTGAVYDIMIFDVAMPHMDGIEFLKVVRLENLLPKATLVVLTNETSPSLIEEAKSLMVDGYIVKSTSIPSEVFDTVSKIHAAKNKK